MELLTSSDLDTLESVLNNVRHVIGDKWDSEDPGMISGNIMFGHATRPTPRKFSINPPKAMQESQSNLWLASLTEYIAVVDPDTISRLLREHARLKEAESKALKEAEHWKSNHECEVSRARVLKERPDMPLERVNAYNHMTALEEENKRLKAQIASLESRMCERSMLEMIQSHSINQDHILREVRDILKSHFRTNY